MWSARFLSRMNHVSASPTDENGPRQGQRKTLTRVGIEPTTFGLDFRRSTDWATRSDGSRPWELKMLKWNWAHTRTEKNSDQDEFSDKIWHARVSNLMGNNPNPNLTLWLGLGFKPWPACQKTNSYSRTHLGNDYFMKMSVCCWWFPKCWSPVSISFFGCLWSSNA